jgi:predicted Zn-dependent protease with MMP-like domain
MAEPDWVGLAAPSLDTFEAAARAALAGMPDEFRAFVGELELRVADFPHESDLAELELDSPFDLLGLFVGVGMAEGPATPTTGQMPNRIWLYRRPILDYWAEHEETLGAVITHVLIHEIGHHFGLSDEDMDAIEAAAG